MEAWREELYHYGIPGMKWGVRRYQNADGSLTALGRRRYGDLDAESARKKIREDTARQYDTVTKLTKASTNITAGTAKLARRSSQTKKKYTVSKEQVKSMSDQELRTAINRILLENQYRELTSVKVNNTFKNKVAEILDMTGDAVAVAGGIAGIAALLARMA